MSDLSGVIESLVPYQAIVEKVFDDGRIQVKTTEDSKEIIPPVYYGGVRDSGLFMHPDVGDTLLCVRVHPGSKGVTQAIRILPGEGKDKRFQETDGTVPAGSSPYPKIEPGDVKILSAGGGEINLLGKPLLSEVSMMTPQKSGLVLATHNASSFATTVSDVYQNVNSGSRVISGDAIRNVAGSQADVNIGHTLSAYSKITGKRVGVYAGVRAQETYILGSPRNPVLSEYRMVINEFSETSAFSGWDEELSEATSQSVKEYKRPDQIKAIDPRTSLSLAPHQLVEVIAGNVINSRGESLDINYGTIRTGDSSQRPVLSAEGYESDRLKSRRGLGYHFQLSTNSVSSEKGNDTNNFTFGIDKQGLLKVSVPKGQGMGNVVFPTDARFGSSQGGVYTSPLHCSIEEGVPVTLRDKKGQVVHPASVAAGEVTAVLKRKTGIRFSNNEGYFQNFESCENKGGAAPDSSGKVRVNFTAHHNMYAAAEMLIANTIEKVLVPESRAECVSGIVIGNPVGEPFERSLGRLKGGELKDNELKFMSTVAVSPGPPAMDPGGDTIVAGKSYLSPAADKPFTNSFSISGEGDELGASVGDGSSRPKDPGGKSANINFEGAVDLSIGKDNHDEKSLVLDTAGSLIAWFGRDKNDRSIVVQTDGSVAVNVGGRGIANGKEDFREGRLDLRVNVNDKGPLHQKDTWMEEKLPGTEATRAANASDYIISISKEGLVIAGMNPGAKMIIRNDGDLALEAVGKLSLAGQSVEVREGNRPGSKTWKSHTATNQRVNTAESVAEKVSCIVDILSDLADS